jgi:hypothetical protein
MDNFGNEEDYIIGDIYSTEETETDMDTVVTGPTESSDISIDPYNTMDVDFNFIYENDDDDRSISYYHEIYDIEKEFIDSEKKDGQYVIGISAKGYQNDSIYACGVTSKTFYQFPYRNILKYLFYYSIMNVYYPVVDVIQIHIDKDETYISIRKTYWISLIQRHWRKIMKARDDIHKKRRSLYSLIHHEIKGNYPSGLNSMPTLAGMLSCYSRK